MDLDNCGSSSWRLDAGTPAEGCLQPLSRKGRWCSHLEFEGWTRGSTRSRPVACLDGGGVLMPDIWTLLIIIGDEIAITDTLKYWCFV